jgi:hypothetical protein
MVVISFTFNELYLTTREKKAEGGRLTPMLGKDS